MKSAAVLAFDLGASSGRGVVGTLTRGDGSGLPHLTVEEVRRFPNEPVEIGEHLYWDVLRLLHEIKTGIMQAYRLGFSVESIGIDTWGVDFGLLDKNGELLGNPYHYRDPHTDGMMEEVCGRLGRERLFQESGLQFQPFNTLYQLYAMKKANSPLLQMADALLFIPDLLAYFLTGQKACEFTIASTSQMLHPIRKDWNKEMLAELGIPADGLLPLVQPGAGVGLLRDEVCRELNVSPLPVIAVGGHDTASAVAAVPAEEGPIAYLISGTWSLLGTELPSPVLKPEAQRWNFTNEGGVGGTYRLLKNIMGMWLIQECKREWEKAGREYTFAEMAEMAKRAPEFRSFIDPNDARFLHPGGMPDKVRQYCRDKGQPVPETDAAIIRCIYESLAFACRKALEQTEALAGLSFAKLHMVGGGIQNTFLCQFTCNAIGRPVWAGPVEGSAIGNVMLQFMAAGHVGGLKEARAIVSRSFPVTVYAPQDQKRWNDAYQTYAGVTGEQVA